MRERTDFVRFWAASTVSGFGSYVTTLALQVLVVATLAGTAADVGVVNAARWLPYLVLGLVAGVLADRLRRRPMLVVTDLGRAVLLIAIPLLALAQTLTVPLLAAFMVVFGTLSLVNDAAHQSFLPRLVPRRLLAPANARLEQSAALAQTSGPMLGGGLVSWLGAPVAVRAVADGTATLSPKVTATLIESYVGQRAAPRRAEALRRIADLSGRERDVLRLLGSGESNAELARKLYVSEATVKTYVSRLLTKLDLTNRTQAAILAHEAGLLDPDRPEPR